MIPRVVLTRCKMHNKENNITVMQQISTDNVKSSKSKQKIWMKNTVCEDKNVLQKGNNILKESNLKEMDKVEGNYQEKGDPVTAVASNKCRVTNIETINTKFVIQTPPRIDVEDNNSSVHTNIDMFNINDISDSTNSRIEINDLSLSSTITNMLETQMLECNDLNLSQLSDLLYNDVPFKIILDNHTKEQLPSTFCKLQETKTNNANDLHFAQKIDTKIQEKIVKNNYDYIQNQYSSATGNSEETGKLRYKDDIKCKEYLSSIQNNDSTISTGIDVSNTVKCASRQETNAESDPDFVQSEYSSTTSDSEETEKSEHEDDSKYKKDLSSIQNDTSISTGMDVSNVERYETRQDEQTLVPTKCAGTKKNMCVFCHKMQTKIVRHLELVHSKEEDVRKFKYLPKGCSERRKIIDILRKRGNFKFNIEKQYEGQSFIPCRRARENKSKILKNYLACGNCKGHYLKSTLRHHFKKCTGREGQNSRIVKVMGRRLEGKCLKEASERVRRLVLPAMRNDDLTRNIRYDNLLILYANSLSKKYRHSSHHLPMIRARLRLVSRLLTEMRNINNDITSLTCMYDPKYYDTFLDAVNIVAQYNREKDVYERPANASNLGTYVKNIGELLIMKCIKDHNDILKTNTENFLKLLTVDYGASVNKTVVESQTQFKRHKVTKLPTLEDIKLLRNHLLKVQRISYNNLKKKFSLSDWRSLGKATLTSMQLFNRRRPGETERILISDFKTYEKINETIETFSGLSKNKKELAQKYVRFCLRGKLGRTVPIILDEINLECVQMFLQFRNKAKVHPNNPYLFGIPGHDKATDKHLKAYQIMLQFAKESGTEFPDTLRGTTLRKHVATMGITLNLTDNQITDLAHFMGHHEKIHMEVYRKPEIVKDITEVSQLLEAAQGIRDEANNLIEESDSEDEINNNSEITENRESFEEIGYLQQSSDSSFSTPTYKKRTKTELKAVQRKRRSGESFAVPVKRTNWTEEEKKVVLEKFEEQLRCDTTITGKQMQDLICNTPCLATRTVPQMRTWLHTHKKKLDIFPWLGDTGHGWASSMGAVRSPHVKVICPTAPTMPVTLNAGFRMPSWFDLRTLDSSGPEDEEGIRKAVETVHSLIAEEVAAGIPTMHIVLGGFSQGGALAMFSALTFPEPLAGIIVLSTWLPLHKKFPEEAIGNRNTPLLQCHGYCDPIVAYRWGQMTASLLKQFMTQTEFKIYRGMMHTSSEEEMRDIKKFIEKVLKP